MGALAYDKRLLRAAPAVRVFTALCVAAGVLTALLVIAQAWLLAEIIAGALSSHRGLDQLRGPLAALLAVLLARASLAWAAQVLASRSSTRAQSDLRMELLRRSAASPPDQLQSQRAAELATLATRGIDSLDGYFARYLPQLFLALVVPVAVLVAVAAADWISAAIIACTLPLVPLFMALVGATTRERMDGQFRLLQRLGSHFLDAVAGLPTLKIFGRAKAQTALVGEITDRYRTSALATLRVSFLSSLILELVSMISVALVAVAIGLRLLGGDLDLRTGLFVLVLAPEAYMPLRALGANYHASAEGMSSAQQILERIEHARPRGVGRVRVPDPATSELAIEKVTVHRAGRAAPVIEELTLTVQAGEVLALSGPSGCGKSTLLEVLLRFVVPSSGSVRVGDVSLGSLDPAAWYQRLAWVPQRPHLFAASIAENIRIGRPGASAEEVSHAARLAGLGHLLERDAGGLDAPLGERGAGLAAGERQRVAIARAFLRGAPLMLLDEPTASLDGTTEHAVIESLRGLLAGRTAIVVAHRPALFTLADRVHELEPARTPA